MRLGYRFCGVLLLIVIAGCSKSGSPPAATASASATATPTATPASASWQNLVRLQSFTEADIFEGVDPFVAMNDAGQMIAVWTQYDGVQNKIYKAERAADGTWTVPSSLTDYVSFDGAGNAYNPIVAINGLGAAVITWEQYVDSNHRVFKAERATNGTWTLPTSVSDSISVAGTDAYNPRVVMNDAGQAIVTWKQYNLAGTAYKVYKSERATNGTWTNPANLADCLFAAGQGVNSNVLLAMNATGQAIITWVDYDGTHYLVYKAERATNGTWTQPASLADAISTASLDASSPSVAMNASGQAVVAFSACGATCANQRIYKSERATNGTWTTPSGANDYISVSGDLASNPVVAINTSGQAIVSWMENDGTNSFIFKAERATNGTWTLPANLADFVSLAGQSDFEHQIAMNDLGQAVISFTGYDGTSQQIYKAVRAANGSWTAPANANDNVSPNGQSASSSQVAMNASGEAVIVSKQSHPSGYYQIYKAVSAANGTWTPPSSLNDHLSPLGIKSETPQVAMNASGQAVAAWSENDGTLLRVFKAERDAAGTWTKPTSIADFISPAAQAGGSSPKVAINSLGQAIIVWDQSNGTNNQIFKAERAANGTWTLPASVNDNISPDGYDFYSAYVGINSSGQVLVVYGGSDGSNYQIYKAERAANGTWTQPANINDHLSLGTFASFPSDLAFNDAGQAIVTWTSNGDAYKAERATDGTWSVPANAADIVSLNTQTVSSCRVVMNADGAAVLIWVENDGSNSNVYKAERATNGTWTRPANLAAILSLSGTNAYYPQAAINSVGQSVVTWLQNDGTYDQVYKAERATNGTWTRPANLAACISASGPATYNPQVDLNASGEAIITWGDRYNGYYQIYKAQRSAAGTWTVPSSLSDTAFTNTDRINTQSFIGTSRPVLLDTSEIIFGYSTFKQGAVVSQFK